MSQVMECDVLVIGSGASGLAAAVTAASHGLKVIVAEKSRWLGGTSAWSGGWLWVPRNPLAVAEGAVEAQEAPERYLREQVHGEALSEAQRVYLQRGPEMVGFFQRNTAVQFYSGSAMPDMRDGEGSARGGRSLCAQPFDGRALGAWIERLRPPLDIVSLFGMGIAGGADMAAFFNARRSPKAAWHVGKRLVRHGWDLLRHGRGMHLVNGNALVARLLRSALDLEVQLLTGSPAVRLLREGERVSGAVLGGERQVIARRGVVLACGGFAHDPQRLAQRIGHRHHCAAPLDNSGDGLRLGETAGGWLGEDLAHDAAWVPVSLVPRRNGSPGRFPHLVDRGKPGFIAVDAEGRRFTNEADCYHDFMTDLFARTPAGQEPCAWMICDRQAQRRFGIGWAKPWPFSIGHYRRCGYLVEGRDARELAQRCGLDPQRLVATIERFNQHARVGHDPDFGRGQSAYNRALGDPANGPNPSLRALQGRLYAVRLVAGSLGTFAGLKTDAAARVLDRQGQVIPGLHAVGNDMDSIMGGYYPSGGITLGPGMTFGYLAGLALAESSA